jgi:hypothetical protein
LRITRIVAAAAALAVAGLVAPTAQAVSAAPVFKCNPGDGGGYKGGSGGLYRHCGRSNVFLRVEFVAGSDRKVCVRPGDTNLHQYSPNGWAVTYASYMVGSGSGCTPGGYGYI